MPTHRKALWDESDPYYAPGLKRLKRAGLDAFYWRPRDSDTRAGFKPTSRELPRGEDDDAVRERAALCRKYERELHEWRLARKRSAAARLTDDGTFASIASAYQTDADSPFQDLRHSTQTNYGYYLKPVVKKLGKRRIAETTGKDLRRWHKEFTERFADPERGHDGHAMARQCMQMIRVLAKYAVECGHTNCAHIPVLFENMRFKGGKARTLAPGWADILALVAKADEKGRPSIGHATLLQFELGQRQGDIIGVWEPCADDEDTHGIVHNGQRWGSGVLWSDITPDWTLTIAQNKSGGETVLTFDLRAYPVLFERLKSIPPEQRVGPIIVSEATGRPYKRRDFAATFREIATAAGWPPEMRSMDARAGAATEIGEAVHRLGIDGEDVVGRRFIESHTGHRDPKMSARYMRTTTDMVSRVAKLRQQHREKG